MTAGCDAMSGQRPSVGLESVTSYIGATWTLNRRARQPGGVAGEKIVSETTAAAHGPRKLS